LYLNIELKNILYVSYLLPAYRVAPSVPSPLRLSTVDESRVYVSVVVMRNDMVRLNLFPFIWLNYDQINVRTYVIDPKTENRAVYFINSGVNSRFISLITGLFGISWKFICSEKRINKIENSATMEYQIWGDWSGQFKLDANISPEERLKLEPFEDIQSGVDYILQPLVGLIGDEGQIRRFTISHDKLVPISGQVNKFLFPLLPSIGIMDEDRVSNPDSVLYVPEATFHINMPPQRLKNIKNDRNQSIKKVNRKIT
jgi:hypothetical protein